MTHSFEPPYISYLQHDGKAKDDADAGESEQPLEFVLQTDLPEDDLFDLPNLAGEMLDRAETGHYREPADVAPERVFSTSFS